MRACFADEMKQNRCFLRPTPHSRRGEYLGISEISLSFSSVCTRGWWGLAYVQAWDATKTTLLLMAHIWEMEEPDTWKRCDHYTDSNYPSGGSNGSRLSRTRTHTHTQRQRQACNQGWRAIKCNAFWWTFNDEQSLTRRFNKEQKEKSGQERDKEEGRKKRY